VNVPPEFNQARVLAAARRDAVIARTLTDRGGMDDRQAALVSARWGHPDWSWKQVAESLGLTKHQAIGAFRRLAERAGLR
jgi:hypothetical protein